MEICSDQSAFLISAAWQEVEQRLEGGAAEGEELTARHGHGPGPVQYREKTPSPGMKSEYTPSMHLSPAAILLATLVCILGVRWLSG